MNFQKLQRSKIGLHRSGSGWNIKNGVLHFFIFAKMRFLKKRGKARKTKKTGENRRFSVLHLYRPEHLAVMTLKDTVYCL